MYAKIISNRRISHDSWEMSLFCPEIVSAAKPGQFIMVRVKNDIDAFLRRPLSIHDIKKSSSFRLLYKIVGRGTELISSLKAGEELDMLGPLGTGFRISRNIEVAILVSGGIGIAPMVFLQRFLRSAGKGIGNLKMENIFFL